MLPGGYITSSLLGLRVEACEGGFGPENASVSEFRALISSVGLSKTPSMQGGGRSHLETCSLDSDQNGVEIQSEGEGADALPSFFGDRQQPSFLAQPVASALARLWGVGSPS